MSILISADYALKFIVRCKGETFYGKKIICNFTTSRTFQKMFIFVIKKFHLHASLPCVNNLTIALQCKNKKYVRNIEIDKYGNIERVLSI